MTPLVLIVEDEPDIARLLGKYLEHAGLRVSLAHDGLTGLDRYDDEKPALVLLDLMLPGLSGWEVLRSIRLLGTTPVIVLTAQVSPEDRVRGFELGVDDYVTKPFNPKELVLRVQAVLRRSGVAEELHGRAGLTLNTRARRAARQGQVLELRPTEFALLAKFVAAPDRVFSRAELLSAVGDEHRDTLERTVDVHIRNLRQKLGTDHGIETVFGLGYRYARD